MSTPQVSIVMPVFNRAWSVGEAIDSVLALDFTDWELVIVDDGSTDGTSKLLLSYADRHPGRLRVLTHPGAVNRGIAASRNLGVAGSNGRYLAFLDSDDLYAPHRLTEAIAWLERHPKSMACIDPYSVETIGVDDSREEQFHLTRVSPAGFGWLRAMLFESNYWLMPGITLRRSVFDTIGGFDERIPVGEDTVLWLKLAIAGGVGVAQAERPVATIRHHAGHSWAPVAPAAGREIYMHILFETLRWLDRAGIDSAAPRQMLEAKLRTYLVETLADTSFKAPFKSKAWWQSVRRVPGLAWDRQVMANLGRAVIGPRA